MNINDLLGGKLCYMKDTEVSHYGVPYKYRPESVSYYLCFRCKGVTRYLPLSTVYTKQPCVRIGNDTYKVQVMYIGILAVDFEIDYAVSLVNFVTYRTTVSAVRATVHRTTVNNGEETTFNNDINVTIRVYAADNATPIELLTVFHSSDNTVSVSNSTSISGTADSFTKGEIRMYVGAQLNEKTLKSYVYTSRREDGLIRSGTLQETATVYFTSE